MSRRNVEAAILISLAILTVAMLIALAARGKERSSLLPGPTPP